MLYRPTSPPLPRQRMSPTAMAAATAIHVAVIWLLWKHSPIQPAIRYVVYQYVQPISPSPGASRAITVSPPAPKSRSDSAAVFSRRPESSVPLRTTTALPDTLQSREPVPRRRSEAPAPATEAPAPRPPPVPAPPVPSPPPVPPPPPEPIPPEPVPAPAPVPIPAPVPAPAPLPEPVPAPAPIPVPAPSAVPAPAPVAAPDTTPPAPAPVPAPPAPLAAPAPAPEALPAPPAPPVAPTQRLQGPVVDVPVAPGSPGAANATTVVVPAPAGGGWGTAPAAAPPARPALPPAPVLVAPLPALPGPYRDTHRSLADMANAQLRGKGRDALADDMGKAAVDDCLHAPGEAHAAGGLLAAPIVAARALAGRCAR